MDYFELECAVEAWAKEKGILEKGTPLAQQLKTEEEVTELKEALIAQSKGMITYTNSKGVEVRTQEEIIDGLGDVFVTLIIQAKMQGLQLEHCLETAYNVISNRTGEMKDGQFVKD